MGENKTVERSFREINELWDQRDAPGWVERGIELRVDVLGVRFPGGDGVETLEQWCIISEVGGRGQWLIPLPVVPAVMEGLRKACLYEHRALIYSEGGHVVRRIMLNHVVNDGAKDVVQEVLGFGKEYDKLIIAVKMRRGRNAHGVIVYEKLVILANAIHVLLVPVEKIPSLLRILNRVVWLPRLSVVHGTERLHTIGTVH